MPVIQAGPVEREEHNIPVKPEPTQVSKQEAIMVMFTHTNSADLVVGQLMLMP